MQARYGEGARNRPPAPARPTPTRPDPLWEERGKTIMSRPLRFGAIRK